MVRIKTAFPKSIVALIAFARFVNTSITGSPNFAAISAAFSAVLAQLAEDIERLQKAQDDAVYGGTNKTSYRDQSAAQLVSTLKNVVRHVELHANGDVAVMKSGGFEVVDLLEKKWKIPDVLPQLAVTLQPGDTAGTWIAKTAKIPYALGYEADISQGDPTIAENFKLFGYFDNSTHGENFNSLLD